MLCVLFKKLIGYASPCRVLFRQVRAREFQEDARSLALSLVDDAAAVCGTSATTAEAGSPAGRGGVSASAVAPEEGGRAPESSSSPGGAAGYGGRRGSSRWLAKELRRRKEQADVDVRHVQAALLAAAHEVDDCLKRLAVREQAARDAAARGAPAVANAATTHQQRHLLPLGAATAQQEALQRLRDSVRGAYASTAAGAGAVGAAAAAAPAAPSSPGTGGGGGAGGAQQGADWLHGRLQEARTVALRCYDFLRDVTTARTRAMLLVQPVGGGQGGRSSSSTSNTPATAGAAAAAGGQRPAAASRAARFSE